MNGKTPFLAILAALLIGGCATLFDGTAQEVRVVTDPPGADCTLTRAGATIGRVNPTPGTVTIAKTSDEIAVSCTKEGYEPALRYVPSGLDDLDGADGIGVFIPIAAIVAFGVDSASGADNQYRSPVYLDLASTEAPPPAQHACAARGTLLRTSDGRAYRFGEGNGLHCPMTDIATGQTLEHYGLVLSGDDSFQDDGRAAIFKLWPLAIGNTAQFIARQGTEAWTEYYEVTGRRRVTVPAGTFAVYVVEHRERALSGRDSYRKSASSGDDDRGHRGDLAPYSAVDTSYVSVDRGIVVKWQYSLDSGRPDGRPDWEAIAVTPPSGG